MTKVRVPTQSSVPEGWRRVRLTEVARLESGHTPSKRQPDYWGGTIPWVSLHDTEGLDAWEIQTTSQSITEAGLANSSARLLPKGTVVFSRTATVGKCTVMGRAMATSQDFACYVCGPKVHNFYLAFLLRSMRAEWKKLMAGSIHNTVYMPVFKTLAVDLPPRDEQVAIANAMRDVERMIDSLEQLLTKKRQIKQGAMQELLTCKRRLPGFHDTWVPRSMADLFEFSGGLSASRDQLGDVGVCYLHYGDIHLSSKTFIDLDLEHSQMPRLEVDLRRVSPTALLQNGDVVFVDASEDDQGISKHVVIHCQVARPLISGLHTIVARSRTDELVDMYKRFCFQAPSVHVQFRFYAVGTKVSGVSKGNIGKIILNIPSREEQTEIAACLAEMDAEIRALESRLTKARALKQAMAQALLTRRIRIPLYPQEPAVPVPPPKGVGALGSGPVHTQEPTA